MEWAHCETVQCALSKTVNMQLQQRDELRYICAHFLCDFCHDLRLDVAG